MTGTGPSYFVSFCGCCAEEWIAEFVWIDLKKTIISSHKKSTSTITSKLSAVGKKTSFFVSGPCHVWNSSSHWNTEVKQHWAWMGDHLETPDAAYKNQSRAPLWEHVTQADGGKTLSRHTGSGKVWTVFQTAGWQLLQSGPPDYWPLE